MQYGKARPDLSCEFFAPTANESWVHELMVGEA